MIRIQARIEELLIAFQDRPWIQALIVFCAAFAAAWALTLLIEKVIQQLTARTRFQLDSAIVAILHQPVYYSILTIGLAISLDLSPVSGKVEQLLVAVLQTVNICIWTIFFTRLSRILLRASARHTTHQQLVNPQSLPLFENLAFFLVFGVALYLGFQVWGIDMTTWLASAGVLAIAIGFAAKDTLSNFIAGIFILAEAPYKIGDFIVLDTGERGEVTEIGIRSTRLLTRDDVELTIPNGIMGNSKIVNESGGPYPKFRISIPVGVAYGSDIDKVRRTLMEVAGADARVCAEPAYRVRFRRFGPSSLDFDLLCWVEEPALRGLVVDTLLTEIDRRFREEGIEIPFAKQDLYIKEMPGRSAPEQG